MKYLGKRSVSSFLRKTVNVIWYISLVLIVPNVVMLFSPTVFSNIREFLITILYEIAFIAFLIIIYQLRKIFKSLTLKEPFTMENVKSFRIIGISIIFIGLFDLIYNVSNYGINGFYILHLDEQGISSRCGVVIFLFLGIMALVLGEIFKSAMEIKEENNLTI